MIYYNDTMRPEDEARVLEIQAELESIAVMYGLHVISVQAYGKDRVDPVSIHTNNPGIGVMPQDTVWYSENAGIRYVRWED